MKHLINDVYEIIKDYRSDEPDIHQITQNSIEQWINQFDRNDKEFLLKETKLVLDKYYSSKEKTQKIIKKMIRFLSKKLGYANPAEFLDNASFLDLQENGKSQSMLLGMLEKILKQQYNYDFTNVGNQSKKHFVYIDDVLCTGNTFYYNLSEWLQEKESGKTRLDKLRNKEIDLSVVYLFIATDYYNKKLNTFCHEIDGNFRNMVSACAIFQVEDELLKPTNDNQPALVTDYEVKVIKQADEHAGGKYLNPPNFYRTEGKEEELFSSKESRIRFENILLKKGIEILRNSNVTINNIRPLGFSLPSSKDFGFGALFFTWRNVPNNTPLVFWYSGGGFLPLFIKK